MTRVYLFNECISSFIAVALKVSTQGQMHYHTWHCVAGRALLQRDHSLSGKKKTQLKETHTSGELGALQKNIFTQGHNHFLSDKSLKVSFTRLHLQNLFCAIYTA